MIGSIESQKIDSILTDIFNLKLYPNELVINDEFCCAVLLSEYYFSRENYINNEVLSIIKSFNLNRCVSVFSLDCYFNGGSEFEIVYSGTVQELDVDRVCREMQCYSFIITMQPNDYIIGLDEEVVIFISRKNHGVIDKFGGVDYFKKLFDNQREYISNPLDVGSVENLDNIFYKK